MNTSEYAQVVNWKWIKETEELGTQCVALVKDAIKNIFNIQLGTFWGSAKTGWYNKSNTFPSNTWDKIENDVTRPNQVPVSWDVVFFNTWVYGHTGIVLKAYQWENRILVLDQNTGNWDGTGDDDLIRIQEYTYRNVYGWYHYQMNINEFEGLPVKYSDDFVSQEWVWASYIEQFKRIIITSDFYKVSRERQEAVLRHEHSHHIYHTMPELYKKMWVLISKFDSKIEKYLAKKWIHFDSNSYVTNYAKTSPEEDFAECVEEHYIWTVPSWKYANFKMGVAVKLYDKFRK